LGAFLQLCLAGLPTVQKTNYLYYVKQNNAVLIARNKFFRRFVSSDLL